MKIGQVIKMLIFIMLSFETVFATLYIENDVESNIIVHNDRIIFSQAGGSLTVLDKNTGEVLKRIYDRDYSGKLIVTDYGILSISYGLITMLDPVNYEPVWETASFYSPIVQNDILVSFDGSCFVYARNLRNGNLMWTHFICGAVKISVLDNNVLLHSSGMFDLGTAKTVLVDLKSGDKKLKLTPPDNEMFLSAYLDNENIYFLSEKQTNVEKYPVIEKMHVFRYDGNLINSFNFSEDYGLPMKPFVFSDALFSDGKRFKIGVDIFEDKKTEKTIISERKTEFYYNIGSKYTVSNYLNNKGELFLEIYTNTLPIDRRNLYADVDLVILVSKEGYVELFDEKNNKIIWRYVFPKTTELLSTNYLEDPANIVPFRFQSVLTKEKIMNEIKDDESRKDMKIILDPHPGKSKEYITTEKVALLTKITAFIKSLF